MAESGRLRTKILVDWIITASCPLRCEHCIVGALVASAAQTRGDELTTDEAIRLVDWLYDHGTRMLSLTGGEVLVRKDLLAVLDHARSRGMSVCLYTTGLPLLRGDRSLDDTKASAILERIAFLGLSIDMFHDVAGPGSSHRGYTEPLVRALTRYGATHFPDVPIQLFTVLGRRAGTLPAGHLVDECRVTGSFLNALGGELGRILRWRLSPFRYNPESMLEWQEKLLFTSAEHRRIEEALRTLSPEWPHVTLHFGVDYDSFFVYPSGRFRTVRLDNGIDRFVELGDFRSSTISNRPVWDALVESDGETAVRMQRHDILARLREASTP